MHLHREDVRLDDYQTGPQIKNIPIAVQRVKVIQYMDRVIRTKTEFGGRKMNIMLQQTKNWAIGKDNKLLVSIPSDMKFFRETTTGKVVVMGRKTLESFPGGQL